MDRSEITHTLAERLVLAQVDSPFIVPLKFSFQSEQKLYLVLAYVQFFLKRCTYLYFINLGSLTVANFFIIYNANNVLMRNELGRPFRLSQPFV